MTTTVTYSPGKFVWRELFTRDVEGAKRFYGGIIGWSAQDMPMGEDWSYTIWAHGEKQVGGMMDLANLPGGGDQVPPHWSVYVSVDDVDQATERAIAAGGTLLNPCMDIPNVGRFAVIQDPQGAVFNLFKSAAGDGPDTPPGVGDFSWEHLNTSDPDAAVAFYTGVVGWGTMSFGGMTMFTRDAGKTPVAVVSQAPAGVPSHWLTYVTIKDLAATNAKARDLGATVLEERIEVPGKGAFALHQDPWGAFYMLSEPAEAQA